MYGMPQQQMQQPQPQWQPAPRPFPGMPGGGTPQGPHMMPGGQPMGGGMGQPPPWAQQRQAPPWMQQPQPQGYAGMGAPQRPGMGYAQLAQMMPPQQRPQMPPMGGGYGQGGFPQMDPRMAMR